MGILSHLFKGEMRSQKIRKSKGRVRVKNWVFAKREDSRLSKKGGNVLFL